MPEIISMTFNQNSIPQLLEETINNIFLNNSNNSNNSNNLQTNFSNLNSNSNLQQTNSNKIIDKYLKIIQKTNYSLLFIIVILIFFIIYSNKHLFNSIREIGLLKTFIKYPLLPAVSFIGNICISIYFMHKKNLNALEKVSTILCKKNIQKNISEKTNKTVWHDISEICNSNLENIYNSIINDFQNPNINEIFDNPLIEFMNLENDDINKTLESFKKEYNIDINEWKKNIENLKKLFATKYKKYKDIEIKLLDIKDKIKELNDWKQKTNNLFKKIKDDSEINLILNEHVDKKINETGFPSLISNYKKLYLELKVLLKYINNNPETETISKCPICLTNLKDSFIIPCGHCVCKYCLDQQFKIDKKIICPICRINGTKIGKLFY